VIIYSMTICVAGICESKNIIAVADKKLTINRGVTSVSDISENKKIVKLSDSVVALFAGNITNANQVLNRALSMIQAGDDIPTITKKIHKALTEELIQQINLQVLAKFNLDLDTFNAQQKNFDQGFLNSVITTIDQYNLGIEIIIAGKDGDGPQIFVIGVDSSVVDMTPIGYATIGSGSSHANFSLIESECHPAMVHAKLLHAMVKAKRKAEYDPNVGDKSDVVIINDKVDILGDNKVKALFKKFDESKAQHNNIDDKLSRDLEEIINGTTK